MIEWNILLYFNLCYFWGNGYHEP